MNSNTVWLPNLVKHNLMDWVYIGLWCSMLFDCLTQLNSIHRLSLISECALATVHVCRNGALITVSISLGLYICTKFCLTIILSVKLLKLMQWCFQTPHINTNVILIVSKVLFVLKMTNDLGLICELRNVGAVN